MTSQHDDEGRTMRKLDAAWLRVGPLHALLEVLNCNGEEARVIGGAVRNALLGIPVTEIDIATTAPPDEVERRVTAAGHKAVPTGIAHGTLTVIVEGAPFEVTTLRHDVETYGRHAKVEFARDWRADAERRDLTINALSAAPDGTLYDYVGGLGDLARRRVRFIGNPLQRITEDYLRILRFFRFHAAYGNGEHPDAQGVAACIAGRDGLDRLSRERVRMEMMKLLVAPHAMPSLITMADAGLLLRVLGGVAYLGSFEMMAKVEATVGLAPDPVRRLGALAVAVTEDAERLDRKLRLANAERARLVSMSENWRRIAPRTVQEAHARLYRLKPGRYVDRTLLAWARSDAGAHDESWRALATLPERWTVPMFPLRAADFMARGLGKGPALGAALRAAEETWIAADFPTEAAKLSAIIQSAAESAFKT